MRVLVPPSLGFSFVRLVEFLCFRSRFRSPSFFSLFFFAVSLPPFPCSFPWLW